LLADGTLLAVAGMGCRAATLGARAAVGAGACALVSWGMAGGLDPSLSAGAIVLPSEVVGLDGRSQSAAPQWRARMSATIATLAAVAGGKLLTSPKAVGSVVDKAELFRATGAAAVDMESFAIAEVAADHGLPFLAMRVIVDTATDTLPPVVAAAADEEGRLRVRRLLGALARAPAELAPLVRLARRYRAANRSLAAVARRVSWAPPALAGEPASQSS